MKKIITLLFVVLTLCSCTKKEINEEKKDVNQKNNLFISEEFIDPLTLKKIEVTNVKTFPLADMENFFGLQGSVINHTEKEINYYYILVNLKDDKDRDILGMRDYEEDVCNYPCSLVKEIYGFIGSPYKFTDGEAILNKQIELFAFIYVFKEPINDIHRVSYNFHTKEFIFTDTNNNIVEKPA
ncbi:hypothetical protein G7059_08550 [Erysipelothrix sp. HDW6A]|uniref:hypothetical protein n=1 Tax=Erysipelothrix sp. HDW6A TaxID=2714928 RepID=UPI00140DEAEA|nr:hypothetical protein [Erysipelothrix sp. HDW6A]QIK57884.1 hypothetical protein G7059_08550 [Erysipelothrix sp. HDW6A]